ncbi:DUF4238 domain-containing protein [Methylobacterium currus]|uniref:DUF4238 domain-containing protein n=1 Tax=Methylobacterium currus TaxID=2051553 RepID=UPI001E4A2341|nr:DUF4238 domain-containing protein [Methylobacterium currus]UHC17322.1 DUF4238 domain-containing protein [Methylobacterium currus]
MSEGENLIIIVARLGKTIMPDNKNQHFVPKCHLSRFSNDEEGRSVNLLNIRSDRFISNAPIKGQCSRDYFYGKDLGLEKAFQSLEGLYSQGVRDVISGNITQGTVAAINKFSYYQFHRTEAAAKRMAAQLENMVEAVDPLRLIFSNDRILPQNVIILQALRLAATSEMYLDDLRTIFVQNNSSTDFITSDDPCIITNRWLFQRHRTENFGLMNSGLMMILPLNPKYCMISYDSQVYETRDRIGGLIRTNDARDIDALNDLQIIKASQNIYLSDHSQADCIRDRLARISHLRRKSWYNIQVLTHDGNDDTGERYVNLGDKVAREGRKSLIVSGNLYPSPPNWFSKIKIRHKPITHFKHVGVGHVRRKEWLTSSGADSYRSFALAARTNRM